jgi:putative membrane protein insertion efficiency factor
MALGERMRARERTFGPLTVMQRSALRLIRAYQLLLSPMFGGSCRFLPSCSEYASEAVASWGVVRGSLLALRRLARCHPLGAHGYDPVPCSPRDSHN